MGQKWRYLLPSILTLIFIIITHYGHYYYVYLFLLLANILNWYWGEFSDKELKDTLRFFYINKYSEWFKTINAIVLISFVFWAVNFADKFIHDQWNLIGFGITTGIFTGCFIVTLGHDLLHSIGRLQRFLSALLFTIAGIPHFASEHICGHHREVGLENDPTTAKVNEVFYTYFFKITFSNLKSIYFTQYNLPSFIRRKILLANIGMVVFLWSVWFVIYLLAENPLQTLLFFIFQGLVAYFLYELINYIQHYGLIRKSKEEAVTMDLAWNCYYKYTNYILFMLPLHSIHHLSGKDRKDIDLKSGPKMPYLYFVMILMALIPPLWFNKMNGLVKKYNTSAV